MRARSVFSFLLLAGAAHAQTYVVDVLNGPGANFTTIGAALAAVPDGSTILVRPGQYPGFQLGGRSIRILGEPGAVIEHGQLGAILVNGTSPGQVVVLRGLGWSSGSGQALVWITNARGTVIVDGCYATMAMAPEGGLLRIVNSDAVHVRDTTILGRDSPVVVDNSSVTFTRSTLRCLTLGTGIHQGGGRVEIDDCMVEGAGSVYPFENDPVVVGVQFPGVTVVRGATRLVGYQPWGAAYGVGGHGSVVIDPNTVLVNVNHGLASPVLNSVSVRALASCAASTGPLGATASATLTGPPGSACFLFAGFAGPRRAIPGIDQLVWLAAGSEVTIAIGAGSANGGYAVPNVPGLLGVVIGWQGLVFDPVGGLQFSNPSIYAHW